MCELCQTVPGDWYGGTIPANVSLAETAYIETSYSFTRFHSRAPEALTMGHGASAYLGTMFDVGLAGRVSVGDYTLLHGVRFICETEITVGDHVLCSWNVVIMDTYRASRWSADRRAMLERVTRRYPRHVAFEDEDEGRPVRIGNNVWLGFDVCVLPGVRIGDGAIVGARSVVRDDVEPYTIVGGNPAQVLKRLSPPVSVAVAS